VIRGHPRSWATYPIDRRHTTSYSTVTETMYIFLVSYLSKVADFKPTPPAFWCPTGDDPVQILPRSGASGN